MDKQHKDDKPGAAGADAPEQPRDEARRKLMVRGMMGTTRGL